MKKSLFQSLLQLLSIVLFVTTITSTVKADHMAGGQMTYTCIDPDPTDDLVQFEIDYTWFVDSSIPVEASSFGIYEMIEQGNWEFIERISYIDFGEPTSLINNISNSCEVELPLNRVTESYSFKFDIELPISDNKYMVAYQRCCRTSAINNIVDPQETGLALFVEITPEAQRTCDNSPQFNVLPPMFLCKDQPIEVDFSATDLDGDELRYRFCAPHSSGGLDGITSGSAIACTGVTPDPESCLPPYAEVVFLDPIGTGGGFTWQTPLAGDPVVSIDPDTGIINGVPRQVGQYVVGVCVEAYRDGELISEIYRDYYFTVVGTTSSTYESIKIFSSLYPNPTSGLLNIELAEVTSGRLIIKNSTGQIVIDQPVIDASKLQIDFAEHPRGTYFVEILSNLGDLYMERVVVF